MGELKERGRYDRIARFLFSGCFSVRAVCTFGFVGDVCGPRVTAKGCIGPFLSEKSRAVGLLLLRSVFLPTLYCRRAEEKPALNR